MMFELSPDFHSEIFSELKSYFSDLYYFDEIIASKLKEAINDTNHTEITIKSTKTVVDRYFDKKSFNTVELKLVWAQIQIIFKSCYVLILSYRKDLSCKIFSDTDQLILNYPSFYDESKKELDLLLKFRNALKIALEIIPGNNNKGCILKIAARLEGSQIEYITGGGKKSAVGRREFIFEQESGIRPIERPNSRKRSLLKSDTNKSKIKTSISAFSIKKVRSVQLLSDDVKIIQATKAIHFPNHAMNNHSKVVTFKDDFTINNNNNNNNNVMNNNVINHISNCYELDFMSPANTIPNIKICPKSPHLKRSRSIQDDNDDINLENISNFTDNLELIKAENLTINDNNINNNENNKEISNINFLKSYYHTNYCDQQQQQIVKNNKMLAPLARTYSIPDDYNNIENISGLTDLFDLAKDYTFNTETIFDFINFI